MKKTILITGTSTGIGRATALYFAQQGWNVAATMRSQADIAAETEFTKLPNVACVVLDVTDDATIHAAIAETVKRFGKIDVLVNNAGYGADGIFEDMTDEVILRQFNTNVFGLMRVTRAIIPHMRDNKGGTIVQIASMGGRLAFPLFSIYHATKWAVEGFSESLQYELKQFGIKVKIIEPGTIKTEFYGKGRVAIAGKSLPHYKAFVDKCEKVSQAPAQNGITPVEVAKVICRSVDGGWKMRFPAGSPAPMLLGLRKLIPDSWFFAIVRNSYKI
jgi:NAD(P)-dependent dehydrogenase (short-subunit alcohol dehydrogenase family)